MGANKRDGFTIIETMLFLAITGVLITALLVGMGTSINVQRYRDSVTSLQSLLQQQYTEVSTVRNERDGNWTCDASTATITEQDAGGIPRGQTECVLLGRYITTVDNKTLKVSTVVGAKNSLATTTSNDVEALSQYALTISGTSTTEYPVEWGSSLVRPGGDTAAAFSVLILRSPTSGTVRTFVNPTTALADSVPLKDLVTTANVGQPLVICVDGNGLFNPRRMSVDIKSNATSATAIELIGDGSSTC